MLVKITRVAESNRPGVFIYGWVRTINGKQVEGEVERLHAGGREHAHVGDVGWVNNPQDDEILVPIWWP